MINYPRFIGTAFIVLFGFFTAVYSILYGHFQPPWLKFIAACTGIATAFFAIESEFYYHMYISQSDR